MFNHLCQLNKLKINVPAQTHYNDIDESNDHCAKNLVSEDGFGKFSNIKLRIASNIEILSSIPTYKQLMQIEQFGIWGNFNEVEYSSTFFVTKPIKFYQDYYNLDTSLIESEMHDLTNSPIFTCDQVQTRKRVYYRSQFKIYYKKA